MPALLIHVPFVRNPDKPHQVREFAPPVVWEIHMKNRWFPAVALITAIGLLIGCVMLINSYKNPTPANVVEATVDNFEDQVLNSPLPVYVQFYVSKGCKPCEQQAPIVEKLAAEYAGKVRFVRVDASTQMEIAIAAGIKGVPTHFFLKPADGIGAVAEGFLDEATLRKFLDAGIALQKPAQPAPADPANPTGDPAKDPNQPAPVQP